MIFKLVVVVVSVLLLYLKIIFASENPTADIQTGHILNEASIRKQQPRSVNVLSRCKSFNENEKFNYILMCKALDIDIRVQLYSMKNSSSNNTNTYTSTTTTKSPSKILFNSKTLSDAIIFNFINGHNFLNDVQTKKMMRKFNIVTEEKVYNKDVLVMLTKRKEVLQFIGLIHCYRIIRAILCAFQHLACPMINNGYALVRHRIISMEVYDLLEVVFNELVPKYPHLESSPDFNADHKLNHDTQIFDDFEDTLSIDSIILFRDVELLQLVFMTFRRVLGISLEYRISLCEMLLDDMETYRKVLDMLVRLFPEAFLFNFNEIYARDFNFKTKCPFILNYMTPIFRAFMMIDPKDQRDNYLNEYYMTIKNHSGRVLKFRSPRNLCCLSVVLTDSNFIFIRDETDRAEKFELLKVVMGRFYNVHQRTMFTFLKHLIPIRGTSIIFEAILQHFSGELDLQQKADLLVLSLENSSADLTKMLTAISYFDFEVSVDNFQYLDAGIEDLIQRNSNFALESQEEDDFSINERYAILFYVYTIINDSPIETARSIIGGAVIEWGCTLETICCSPENKHIDSYPMLFEYGRVILAKYLKIPLARTAFYDDSRESVSWQEMIGFMNFMVERHAACLGGLDTENIVRFKDSTEYSPVSEVLESESQLGPQSAESQQGPQLESQPEP